MVVDLDCESTAVHTNEEDDEFAMLSKFLYNGDDRNVIEVYVDGVEIKKNTLQQSLVETEADKLAENVTEKSAKKAKVVSLDNVDSGLAL